MNTPISKIIFILILGINFQANAGSKLQLDLTQLDASLNEGFGGISMDLVKLQMDPVKVDLENINYDLSMQDNFFIIEGPGQKLNLDLKSFRKIFEQQKFNAVNTNINIKQGEYIKFDSEYFDVSLKAVKLNFFGPEVSCAPEIGRDITEEILGLCLKKADVSLPQGVMTGLEDVIYQWAEQFIFSTKEEKEKLNHLPKFARPVLTNGTGSIRNGEVIVRADLKLLFTLKLSGTGFIEYQSKEDVITLKINSLATNSKDFKNIFLKALKLIENEFFKVEGDTLVFKLEEMRANSRSETI